jgi:antitoxin (DNA-binding transcriptional repressor) of toxin-antitoxin stability system
MAKVVNVHEAKTQPSRILDEVRAGAECILARDGAPCAKLVPRAPAGKRRLGFAAGRVTNAFFEPLSAEESREWQ